MIIGFDGSRAFSSNRTGTENYSYQLLKALAKIDHKNQYLIYLRPNSVIPPFVISGLTRDPEIIDIDSGSEAGMTKVGMTKQRQGIENNGWPENFKFKILNFPYLWTQVGLAVQTFIGPVDVLFVPAHTLPLIRKPGLKTVVTVHDLGSEYLPQTHQLKQRLYLSLIQKYQLQTATKLIAVSKATKQDLIDRINIPQEQVEVIYEGYDQGKFKQIKNDMLVDRLKYYEIDKYRYFLFVGTVQPRKNLIRLIASFHHVILSPSFHSRINSAKDLLRMQGTSDKLRDSSAKPQNDKLKLVIVGKKGWLSEEIYALPKKLGIENQVKFLDYVQDADLPALYAGAIALVYPSLFEGFGLPILEAQASGCPVITSNISSMPEVAGTGAILVDPTDVQAITDAMIKVMEKDTRSKLVQAGLENVKRFSWEQSARETLKVLMFVTPPRRIAMTR